MLQKIILPACELVGFLMFMGGAAGFVFAFHP